MIVVCKGRQRRGKTTIAVGIALWAVLYGGWRNKDGLHPYRVEDIIANLTLYNDKGEELRTYKRLNNNSMRQYIRHMVSGEYRGKIIIIDEVDKVFSHRFWHEKEQTEDLLGMWQDEKLGNLILMTAHLGLSLDNLIRECMQIEIIPEMDMFSGSIPCDVLNALETEVNDLEMTPAGVQLAQSLFDTYEVVT